MFRIGDNTIHYTDKFFETNNNVLPVSEFPFPLPKSPADLKVHLSLEDPYKFKAFFSLMIQQLLQWATKNGYSKCDVAQNSIQSFMNNYLKYTGTNETQNSVYFPLFTQGFIQLSQLVLFIQKLDQGEYDKFKIDKSRMVNLVGNLLLEFDKCGPGVSTHIAHAVQEIAGVLDLGNELKSIRTTYACQILTDFLSIRMFIGGNETYYLQPGMTIHLINAVIDKSPEYNLTKLPADKYTEVIPGWVINYTTQRFKTYMERDSFTDILKYLYTIKISNKFLRYREIQTELEQLKKQAKENIVSDTMLLEARKQIGPAFDELKESLAPFGTDDQFSEIVLYDQEILEESDFTEFVLSDFAETEVIFSLFRRLCNDGFVAYHPIQLNIADSTIAMTECTLFDFSKIDGVPVYCYLLQQIKTQADKPEKASNARFDDLNKWAYTIKLDMKKYFLDKFFTSAQDSNLTDKQAENLFKFALDILKSNSSTTQLDIFSFLLKKIPDYCGMPLLRTLEEELSLDEKEMIQLFQAAPLKIITFESYLAQAYVHYFLRKVPLKYLLEIVILTQSKSLEKLFSLIGEDQMQAIYEFTIQPENQNHSFSLNGISLIQIMSLPQLDLDVIPLIAKQLKMFFLDSLKYQTSEDFRKVPPGNFIVLLDSLGTDWLQEFVKNSKNLASMLLILNVVAKSSAFSANLKKLAESLLDKINIQLLIDHYSIAPDAFLKIMLDLKLIPELNHKILEQLTPQWYKNAFQLLIANTSSDKKSQLYAKLLNFTRADAVCFEQTCVYLQENKLLEISSLPPNDYALIKQVVTQLGPLFFIDVDETLLVNIKYVCKIARHLNPEILNIFLDGINKIKKKSLGKELFRTIVNIQKSEMQAQLIVFLANLKPNDFQKMIATITQIILSDNFFFTQEACEVIIKNLGGIQKFGQFLMENKDLSDYMLQSGHTNNYASNHFLFAVTRADADYLLNILATGTAIDNNIFKNIKFIGDLIIHHNLYDSMLTRLDHHNINISCYQITNIGAYQTALLFFNLVDARVQSKFVELMNENQLKKFVNTTNFLNILNRMTTYNNLLCMTIINDIIADDPSAFIIAMQSISQQVDPDTQITFAQRFFMTYGLEKAAQIIQGHRTLMQVLLSTHPFQTFAEMNYFLSLCIQNKNDFMYRLFNYGVDKVYDYIVNNAIRCGEFIPDLQSLVAIMNIGYAENFDNGAKGLLLAMLVQNNFFQDNVSRDPQQSAEITSQLTEIASRLTENDLNNLNFTLMQTLNRDDINITPDNFVEMILMFNVNHQLSEQKLPDTQSHLPLLSIFAEPENMAGEEAEEKMEVDKKDGLKRNVSDVIYDEPDSVSKKPRIKDVSKSPKSP